MGKMMNQEKSFEYSVKMIDIVKYFGHTVALKGINFEVGANEVVGLIGDNGAGKSTLIKIITGVFPPSGGELYIRDQKVDINHYNVKKAHELGIETFYQDKSLGEKQPLWRNFFVGRHIKNRLGFIDVKKEKEIAHEIMMNVIGFRGAGITVDSTVSKLSGGERQGIAIGRAMYFDADLIILDEPTVALSLKEIQKVLDFVNKIKESGRSCIYISHMLSHVYMIADRFTILDRGTVIKSFKKSQISLTELNDFLLKYANKK
jgi:simple sugar transport system ATP-binding protein